MSTTVYIPRDSGGVSMGAGDVADALAAEANELGSRVAHRSQRLARDCTGSSR